MSTMINGNAATYKTAAALSKYQLVYFSAAGTISAATATATNIVGTILEDAYAANEYRAVDLISKAGTLKCISNGAISAGALCYAASDGEVASTGSNVIGIAVNAATADQDIIEVLPTYNGYETATMDVNLSDFGVWDAMTKIGSSASNDDMALNDGTWGSADAYLVSTATATGASGTSYARVFVPVPTDYVNGGAVTVRLNANAAAIATGSTQTVDVECHIVGTPATDICATAAQSVTATAANKDFTLTATSIARGKVLDMRIKTNQYLPTGGTILVNRVQLLYARMI